MSFDGGIVFDCSHVHFYIAIWAVSGYICCKEAAALFRYHMIDSILKFAAMPCSHCIYPRDMNSICQKVKEYKENKNGIRSTKTPERSSLSNCLSFDSWRLQLVLCTAMIYCIQYLTHHHCRIKWYTCLPINDGGLASPCSNSANTKTLGELSTMGVYQ